MTQWVVPTSADLRLIEQSLLPDMTAQDPIFGHFPITEDNADLLIWEQYENITGFTQWRGINGAPSQVLHLKLNQYQTSPGYYGEFMKLDEEKILRSRAPGTFGDVVNVTDLVLKDQVQLLTRRMTAIKRILWNIAQGTYSITSKTGGVVVTDTYSVQTFTAAVTWATSATATPFSDFRAVKLKHRGFSVNFGAAAMAYMNQVTYNNMIGNTNANDLFGKRFKSLSTISSLPMMTGLLNEDDLPTPVVHDEFYLSDGTDGNLKGTVVPYIPNGKVIVIGRRPNGTRCGEFRMTRNLENPNLAPGAYTRVILQDRQVPTTVETHDGFNGGPVIEFPSSIVVMSV
jgi:hypothetical protein